MVVIGRFLRVTLSVALLSLFLANGETQAASPPSLPLPPCTEVDGQRQGACPTLNSDVTAQASGPFSAGGTVMITTDPTPPVCDFHYGYPPYEWAPSPCYSAVSAPSIAGCAVIDLRDGVERFRELACAQALYKNPQDMPSPLLVTRGPTGTTRCNASGDYQIYVYGGPSNPPGNRWAQFGPGYLECAMTFNGPRPDGLYGPTWIKLNVGISVSQTGDDRRGYGRTAQIYVPVDGDMRQEGVDVSVSATVTLDEENWQDGRLLATYTATVRNLGSETARNVTMSARMPDVMAAMEVSDADCWLPGIGKGVTPTPAARFKTGGAVQCEWSSLAVNATKTIRISTRILNATDLHALQSGLVLQNFARQPGGIEFKVNAQDDQVATNNETLTKVTLPFRSGSYAETKAAMELLAPYFDYQVEALTFKTCNFYKSDIFSRLEAIRAAHPEVFTNLSYGGITSGDYYVAGIETERTKAGHVGVVVYTKGTDYRQTGIIINGTPSPSPLDLVSDLGPHPLGGTGVGGWTGLHGLYLRTAADKFPGIPQQEGNGFEGRYAHNEAEFTFGGLPAATLPEPDPMDALSCPAPPDAVMVTTESPVDIQLSNPRGQRVETQGGMLVVQDLDTSIHSIAIAHDDGTFGWTLLLPRDDYDIQLVGTAAGPYRVKLATFDANMQPVEFVTEGTTAPGQIDTYVLDGTDGTGTGPGSGNGPGTGGTPDGTGGDQDGGGGSLGWPAVLGLLPLPLWLLLRGRQRGAVRQATRAGRSA